jgi:hypothetical protein
VREESVSRGGGVMRRLARGSSKNVAVSLKEACSRPPRCITQKTTWVLVVCPDLPPRVPGQAGTDDTLSDIPTRILLQSTRW